MISRNIHNGRVLVFRSSSYGFQINRFQLIDYWISILISLKYDDTVKIGYPKNKGVSKWSFMRMGKKLRIWIVCLCKFQYTVSFWSVLYVQNSTGCRVFRISPYKALREEQSLHELNPKIIVCAISMLFCKFGISAHG